MLHAKALIKMSDVALATVQRVKDLNSQLQLVLKDDKE